MFYKPLCCSLAQVFMKISVVKTGVDLAYVKFGYAKFKQAKGKINQIPLTKNLD